MADRKYRLVTYLDENTYDQLSVLAERGHLSLSEAARSLLARNLDQESATRRLLFIQLAVDALLLAQPLGKELREIVMNKLNEIVPRRSHS